MSGEMMAFLVFLAFTAFVLIVPLIFPVGFKAAWDTIFAILSNVTVTMLQGWTGDILVIGYVVVVWVLIIGAAVMALQKIYKIFMRVAR